MKLRNVTYLAVTSFAIAAVGVIAAPGDFPQRRNSIDSERPAFAERGQAGRFDIDREAGLRGSRAGQPGQQGLRPGGPGGPNRPGGAGGFGPGDGSGPMGPELHKFWENENVVAAIELTDTQIALLEESWALASATLEEHRGDARETQGAIREEMQKDNPDVDVVYGLIDDAAEARTLTTKARMGHQVVVKNTLTAEQEEGLRDAIREVLREKREEIGDQMREIRDLIRDLRSDGELSEEDRAQIAELISELPPEVQERILDRLDSPRPGGGPDGRPGMGDGPGMGQGFGPGPSEGGPQDRGLRPERFGRNS